MPVMFSIHGGGFVNGNGNKMFAAAPVFSAENVVLVTFNYRLGALGFLAHPELDRERGVNYALMDMIAALQWVRDNIAAFGGDPRRVTILPGASGSESTRR